MVCHAFLAAIESTQQRRRENPKIRYPYKDKHFYPLLWPAQAVCVEATRIVLPMGHSHASIVLPKPDNFPAEPGGVKLIWNGCHPELHVTIEQPVVTNQPGTARATVDLGQIHLAAVVTSTGKGLIVSGRGIRSLKRQHSKQLGELARKRSRCTKGSRRWKKLQRARAALTLTSERRIKDLRHKATRQVIDFCEEQSVGTLYVGNPDGVRRHRTGRHHQQRMSQWAYGQDIQYLKEKAQRAALVCSTGSERGTSSRCPECGHRHRPKGRTWTCKICGFSGHRDLVGATNMHVLGFGSPVECPSHTDTTYRRPGPLSWRGQTIGHEDPMVGSRSRPVTGHQSRRLTGVADGNSTFSHPDRRGRSGGRSRVE